MPARSSMIAARIRVRRDGVEREVLLRAERVLPAAVEASAALR